MKLTIWQQFSSNHSAMYTIVGVFPSREEALGAGEKLRNIVEKIAQEAKANPRTGTIPNDYEQALGEEYGFLWKQAVDWLRFFPRHYKPIYVREPADYVMIAENMVIVDAPHASATWQTGHQFVNLIEALGGKSFSGVFNGEDPDDNSYVGMSILVDLSCHAPNETIAKNVYEALNLPKASRLARRVKLAWVKFVPNFDYYCKFAGIQNFDEIEAQWIKEVNAWHEFYEANKIDYDALRKETSSPKDFHKLEAEKRAELFSHQSKFFHLEGVVLDAMNAIYREAEFSDGKLLLNNNEVQLLEATFEIALVAFVQWSRSLRCEVSYGFRQG